MKVELTRIDHCTIAINGIEPRGVHAAGSASGAMIVRMFGDMMDLVLHERDFWAVLKTGDPRIVDALYARKDTRTWQQVLSDVQRMIDGL